MAGDREIPINGATCGELAAAAGIDAEAANDLYKGGDDFGPDEILGVDAEAAQQIEEFFGRNREALTLGWGSRCGLGGWGGMLDV